MWGWCNQLSLPRVEAELGFDNSNILNKPYSIIDKYAFPDEASLRSPWVSASWAIDHAGLHQYIYHYVCLIDFLWLCSFVSNITILDDMQAWKWNAYINHIVHIQGWIKFQP